MEQLSQSRADQSIELMRAQFLEAERRKKERIEVLQTDYLAFVKQVFRTLNPDTEYVHNWHIDAINAHLKALESGEFRKLIINIPPRSMKTISTTVAWVAWLIGHNPARKFMLATYSSSLAQRNMTDLKKVLNSLWFKQCFPNFAIDSVQDTKKKILTTKGGHVISGSFGSKDYTGEGADYIIVDDPHDPQMAQSQADRPKANEWFTGTLVNRLNDKTKGIILVVMQRLHEDDLTGHLLAKANWAQHLCLAAKSEETTTIECGKFKKIFKKDELLDPIRLSQDILDELKKTMTSLAFAGQYQQTPVPQDGGILKKSWWRKWKNADNLPDCDYVIQTVDTAFKDTEAADSSVIQTWGIFTCTGLDGEDRPACILLDSESGQWQYPDLKAAMLKSYKIHRPDKVIIEDKASGQSLIQDLRRMRLPITRFKVENNKVYRAHMASIVLEKGHVFYVEKDWAERVRAQCSIFPNGLHDDEVDAATISWLYLRKRYWLGMADDDAASDKEESYQAPDKQRRLYGMQARPKGR
jgi:predicted phage terminase large subunit-like protein